jgi:hypothetical protein
MASEPDPAIECDIAAFINGQLDAERGYAVALYLSQHPDRAAEVLADLRVTEGLRAALAQIDTPVPPGINTAAIGLQRATAPRATTRRWLPGAAVALFVLGMAAPIFWPAPRATLTDSTTQTLLDIALDVQDAIALQIALSQPMGPMPIQDPLVLANGLDMELPALPQNWTILASHIVATPERPGLALVIDTPELGEIMLLGLVRTVDGPDLPAEATHHNGRTLAFFERDRTAFVLVDQYGPASALRDGAEALRHRFN